MGSMVITKLVLLEMWEIKNDSSHHAEINKISIYI